MMNNWRNKFIFLAAVFILSSVMSGCSAFSSAVGDIAGTTRTGTVIVRRTYIRSSYAVVAADLLEVKRGQILDILEDNEFEKVHWYRVRAHDEDNTEGWIEGQNIITSELLDKSKKLAQDDKDLQSQASGQLRAASNLRLTPEIKEENVLYKLESGASFEVIDWKYVNKVQVNVDDSSSQDAGSNTQPQKSKNADVEAAKEDNQPKSLDEVYDIWYKVRFDPSISPAPAGWIFGRQVELQVPSDIIFYQNNAKKFVTWHRLDNVAPVSPTDKESARLTKPGSWVILTRSNNVKAKEGDEPDFDGIFVLGYDKYNEQHYSAYRIDGVWGEIPLTVEGAGDNKTFVMRLRNAAGQIEEKRFNIVKDPKGRLRVNPPPDIYVER